MLHFCTYFDHRYLGRGLALLESLRRHSPPFRLWILCPDEPCRELLQKISPPEVRLIGLPEFERNDPELRRAKENRSLVEYYFTCTPSLPLFVLNQAPEIDLITYLDSDLFFFGDPSPLFDEIGQHSVAIIPHRFSPHLRHMEANGLYNVGWVSFRRDASGLSCLRWWRERCLEWCRDVAESTRYADQKYLDEWPSRFPGVHIVAHPGANLAPWNLGNSRLQYRDGRVWVDDRPLIFFHFQGVKPIGSWLFDTNLAGYAQRSSRLLRRHIYVPYLQTILQTERVLAPWTRGRNLLPSGIRYTSEPVSAVERFVRRSRKAARCLRGILTGSYLVASRRRANGPPP